MTCSKIVKLLIIGCLCAEHDPDPIPASGEPTRAPSGKHGHRNTGCLRLFWNILIGHRLE